MKKQSGSVKFSESQARHIPAGPQQDMIPAHFLPPMIAGAWARGIADAYHMMGIAAVLLDSSGRVLHAGEKALRLMDGAMSVVSNHLVGATPAANAAIEAAIAGVIDVEETKTVETIVESATGESFSVRAIRIPDAPDQAVQLLRAVVILSPV